MVRLQIFGCTRRRFWLEYRLADPNSIDWQSNINCLGSCRFSKVGGRKRVARITVILGAILSLWLFRRRLFRQQRRNPRRHHSVAGCVKFPTIEAAVRKCPLFCAACWGAKRTSISVVDCEALDQCPLRAALRAASPSPASAGASMLPSYVDLRPLATRQGPLLLLACCHYRDGIFTEVASCANFSITSLQPVKGSLQNPRAWRGLGFPLTGLPGW